MTASSYSGPMYTARSCHSRFPACWRHQLTTSALASPDSLPDPQCVEAAAQLVHEQHAQRLWRSLLAVFSQSLLRHSSISCSTCRLSWSSCRLGNPLPAVLSVLKLPALPLLTGPPPRMLIELVVPRPLAAAPTAAMCARQRSPHQALLFLLQAPLLLLLQALLLLLL